MLKNIFFLLILCLGSLLLSVFSHSSIGRRIITSNCDFGVIGSLTFPFPYSTMRVLILVLVGLLAVVGLGVVEGRNSYLHSHWRVAKHSHHTADDVHLLRLALKQRNVASLKSFVDRVSDPDHAEYGQYRSLEEIADLIAPAESELKELATLLYQAGAHNVTFTKSRDFAHVVLPVRSVGKLFTHAADGSPAKLYAHTHAHSGRQVLRTRHGAHVKMIPELAQYVDIVTGLTDFFDYPSERKAAKAAAQLRAHAKALNAFHQYGAEGVNDTCVNSAPDFGRIKNSHEDVLVSVILYCQNGAATSKANAPCSDHPPAVASVTVRLIPRAHPEQVITMNIGDLDCELNAASQVVCTFPKQDFPPWAHMRIDAMTTYTDESTSIIGVYGSGLAPSPYVTHNTIFQRYSVPLGTRGAIPNKNSQAVVAFEVSLCK